jgi:hypothetical protein
VTSIFQIAPKNLIGPQPELVEIGDDITRRAGAEVPANLRVLFGSDRQNPELWLVS